MPSALISKVTSISTVPLGARRRPVRMNSPRSSLAEASSFSPCMTMIFTAVWLSRLVVKIFVPVRRHRRVLRDQLLEVRCRTS